MRFRRSVRLMPGVRLTFSRSGVGVSVGVPGARISRSPNGRITRTLGIPGTGLSDVRTVRTAEGARSRTQDGIGSAAVATGVTPGLPPKPGLFAPAV